MIGVFIDKGLCYSGIHKVESWTYRWSASIQMVRVNGAGPGVSDWTTARETPRVLDSPARVVASIMR